MNIKSWLAVIAALMFLPVATELRASTIDDGGGDVATVLYSNSQLVKGSLATSATLDIPSAGELFLTLTDLQFPSHFASLQFALADATATLIGPTGPGTISFDVTGPTTLYADVFATSQSNCNLGLYNLTATFVTAAPVPLPATLWLLVIAGGMLLTLRFLLSRIQPFAATTVTTATA